MDINGSEMTEEEVYQKLLKIERDLNLFDLEIRGVKYWRLIRQKIFIMILISLGVINRRPVNVTNNKSAIKKIINIALNIRFSIFHNKKYSTKTIFFENPRKIKMLDGGYVDPYTFYYIKDYSKSFNDYEIVDIGDNGRHYEPSNGKRFFSEDLYYDIFYALFLKLSFFINKKDIYYISVIEKEIKSSFNCDINVRSLVKSKIKSFIFQFKKYNCLFEKKREMERIFLVASHGKEGLIHAAQLKEIEVIEFQHGVIGKRQLAYNFPGLKKVPYFPDRLFLFGPFWKDDSDFPVKQIKIDFIGFQYLEEGIKRNNVLNKENKVLIISTPGNVRDIIPAMLALAKNNLDYEFIYRLHPKERDFDLFLLYPDFYDAITEAKNITIDNVGVDLYRSFSNSKFVFGVSSTALFEAMMFDTKVILIKSPGIEVMRRFIEQKNVFVLDNEYDLNNIHYELNPVDKKYLYS